MTELLVADVAFRYRRWKGATPTIDGVSFEATSGQVHGLLGHNGAGKSTLLTLVAGLLKPASGSIRLDGCDPSRPSVLSRSALLTERVALYEGFTVLETLRVYAAARKTARPSAAIANAVERLGLGENLHKQVLQLSTGMRKRLALSLIVLDVPPLVLLDEPFSGVDPITLALLMSEIQTWARDGHIVLLATHDLPEVEAVATHVHVFRGGRLMQSGELAAMQLACTSILLKTTLGDVLIPNELDRVMSALHDLKRRRGTLLSMHSPDSGLAQMYRELHSGEV